MEKAAGQGHAYAMFELGQIHRVRKEDEQAVAWFTKGAEAGLPKAMYSLGFYLAKGQGVAAPDYPAVAGWYRRAADAGSAEAALNLSYMYAVGCGRAWHFMPATSSPTSLDPHFLRRKAFYDVASNTCQALGHGVTRSKRKVQQWMRKAAENGGTEACLQIAARMYPDIPCAREVGLVGESAGVATAVGLIEDHDVPQDVLTSVVCWLRKGGHNPADHLDRFRRESLRGGKYCHNEGCVVLGLVKDFKVCPQCKTARYWAPRVRKRTGMRVGTRKSVAHSPQLIKRKNGIRWCVARHVIQADQPGCQLSCQPNTKRDQVLGAALS